MTETKEPKLLDTRAWVAWAKARIANLIQDNRALGSVADENRQAMLDARSESKKWRKKYHEVMHGELCTCDEEGIE